MFLHGHLAIRAIQMLPQHNDFFNFTSSDIPYEILCSIWEAPIKEYGHIWFHCV